MVTVPANPQNPRTEGAVIGWDIGGAHVKASLLVNGRIADVCQWPTPLWQGLQHLDTAIDAAHTRWPTTFAHARHAATMTAEMTDLFEHREQGVVALAKRLHQALGDTLRLYAGASGWVTADDAAQHWRAIASANWRATAALLATQRDEAVLVDIGSTTTDLIPVSGSQILAAPTDATRLASGALVYLGVVRTPLCALARRVRFRASRHNVMNEFFATTADVFRLTGELNPGHDQYPSADGADKHSDATRQRIARMIGLDARDASPVEWQRLAFNWRSAMSGEIRRNLERVCTAAEVAPNAPIVGAGCGMFLARTLAERLNRPFIPFHALIGCDSECADWVDVCAPAVAVAALMATSTT